jgi:gliding motility-associated-like protein
MRPRMYIDTLYRYNPLGCYVECKGQFKTSISGGTPFANDPKYIYEWGGGHSQDTIVFGLCPGKKQFRVTDSLGCRLDTTYLVDFLRSPKIRITFTPTDTVYLTNPTITASFPDSMRQYLSNWTWNLGDSIKIANINPVMHTYSKEFLDTVKVDKDYPVKLMITDKNGCDTTITDSIIFKTAKLVIPNVFTPNGDGANDKFAIELEDDPERDFREAWISNELVVYDRWGRKVHSQVNYKSEDWDGDRLSDGTYFYVLQCIGLYGEEVFRGSLTILRGK